MCVCVCCVPVPVPAPVYPSRRSLQSVTLELALSHDVEAEKPTVDLTPIQDLYPGSTPPCHPLEFLQFTYNLVCFMVFEP